MLYTKSHKSTFRSYYGLGKQTVGNGSGESTTIQKDLMIPYRILLHRWVFQTGVSRQRVIVNHGTFSSPSAQKLPVFGRRPGNARWSKNERRFVFGNIVDFLLYNI